MPEDGDSTAKEIAREAARVLPLVGVPRWAIWLGTLLAVVLYVVAKHLGPLAVAWWRANTLPLPPPTPLGNHQAPTDVPDGLGWTPPTPGPPGGGDTGGAG